MAALNQEMFKKFKQLSTRQEGDGLEVEVREDEEQGVKLQEIIDLLVAAGYFRARIKGLSPFDKVVGGMTWCIESCNVDVDVDLLFQENSTIGQKISLTEKIVAVLPKLQCPHLIEPHQIQGLDFIHIFPVIQWLVKRSMEFRQEMSEFVRCYAINQFQKDFISTEAESSKQSSLLQNVGKVHEVYKPRRYFRRKTGPPEDVETRVQVTLLEYGHKGVKNFAQKNSGGESEEVNEEFTEQVEHYLKHMAEMSDDSFSYDSLNRADQLKMAKHYAALQTELEDGGLMSREEEKFSLLEEQNRLILDHCNKLEKQTNHLQNESSEISNSLNALRTKKHEAADSLKELEEATAKNPKSIKEIEDLVILNDNLRSQEIQFREHCKQELSQLQNLIEGTKKSKTPISTNEESDNELKDHTERLRVLRLQLAKKNRTIAALQRQLDDVPSRAELAQYQRRFLELYNQVAAKHKETKQYYTLYNTLEDTRQYMKKEMSLLNSISDNYPEAMQSSSGKEEFLKQFEAIVESVRQSKMKVDKRVLDEKYKRDQISYKLQGLIELQRKYVTAVKELGIECKRHENNYALQNTI